MVNFQKFRNEEGHIASLLKLFTRFALRIPVFLSITVLNTLKICISNILNLILRKVNNNNQENIKMFEAVKLKLF